MRSYAPAIIRHQRFLPVMVFHAGRVGHQRHQRQVDTAPDDDEAHRHAENAEDRDAADEVQQVVGRQEAGKRNGEADAEQDSQSEALDCLKQRYTDWDLRILERFDRLAKKYGVLHLRW